jgi:hypothetical protein
VEAKSQIVDAFHPVKIDPNNIAGPWVTMVSYPRIALTSKNPPITLVLTGLIVRTVLGSPNKLFEVSVLSK